MAKINPTRIWTPADSVQQAIQQQQKSGRLPSKRLPLLQGMIGLTCANPDSSWTALQGQESIQVTDGYGGWEPIDRPRRKSITHFKGSQPFKLTASFVLDGWTSPRKFIERDIEILENMATVPDDDDHPPAVRFFGPINPRFLNKLWVIDDIDWATDPTLVIVSSVTNDRFRQGGTLHLLEFVPDELLDPQTAAQAHRTKVKQNAKNIRAGHGDTLEKIAKREHASLDDLRTLNPKIKNPGKEIHAGTIVKVPA